jgi:hypothetical protein
MLITVRRARYIGPNPARPATARECRTAQHSAAGCLTGADLSCRPGAEARAMTTAFTLPRTDPIVPTRVEPRINCNQSALHPTHLPWTGGSNAPSLMLQNRLTGACLVVSDLATEIVTSNSSSTSRPQPIFRHVRIHPARSRSLVPSAYSVNIGPFLRLQPSENIDEASWSGGPFSPRDS